MHGGHGGPMSTTEAGTATITLTETGFDVRVSLDPHVSPASRAGLAPTRPRLTGPGLTDTRPLVPCLETLVRFVARSRELAGTHAGFALRAGRSGLALDLPARLLAREFGPGRVARFEDVDFPATLTHEPTRRFLRETGLPEDGFLLQLDTDMPLPTLTEYCADEHPGLLPPSQLPTGADRLIRLGRLVGDTSALVDGTTGEIWNWNEPEATLRPLTADVSTLVLTLWLLHRER